MGLCVSFSSFITILLYFYLAINYSSPSKGLGFFACDGSWERLSLLHGEPWTFSFYSLFRRRVWQWLCLTLDRSVQVWEMLWGLVVLEHTPSLPKAWGSALVVTWNICWGSWGLVSHTCVPCPPGEDTGVTHHHSSSCPPQLSAAKMATRDGKGLPRISSVLLGGCGWDSFPSSMQRKFAWISEARGEAGWAEELFKLPALSRLGFSLSRHTVCSSLMVRVKQEHLLMER